MANRDYSKIGNKKEQVEKKSANPYVPAVKSETNSANPYEDKVIGEIQNGGTLKLVRVQAPFLNLRSEPSKDSKVKIILSKGRTFKVLSEKDGWMEVVYSDIDGDVSGYIMSEYTESADG